MEIVNPHDKFFKETFSNRENAIDLISGLLPEELKSNLDFNSMELDNNSYIDQAMNEYFSDLVYTVNYKGKTELKISLLLEHKSYFGK